MLSWGSWFGICLWNNTTLNAVTQWYSLAFHRDAASCRSHQGMTSLRLIGQGLARIEPIDFIPRKRGGGAAVDWLQLWRKSRAKFFRRWFENSEERQSGRESKWFLQGGKVACPVPRRDDMHLFMTSGWATVGGQRHKWNCKKKWISMETWASQLRRDEMLGNIQFSAVLYCLHTERCSTYQHNGGKNENINNIGMQYVCHLRWWDVFKWAIFSTNITVLACIP